MERLITHKQIGAWLAEFVEQTRGVQRETLSQALLDQAAKACLEDGDYFLGWGLVMLMAARVQGLEGLLLASMIEWRSKQGAAVNEAN